MCLALLLTLNKGIYAILYDTRLTILQKVPTKRRKHRKHLNHQPFLRKALKHKHRSLEVFITSYMLFTLLQQKENCSLER